MADKVVANEDVANRALEMPAKKKCERFKYSEGQMETAIEAVRSRRLKLNQAAREYNIPKGTLSKKVRGLTIEGRRMGPVPVLTKQEEKTLEDWIVGKAKIGFPMHIDYVKEVMKDTDRENPFKDDRPGDKWCKLFLKRHPLITQRNAEVISRGKACLTEASIRKWFQELEDYLKQKMH